ncbi:hypothetical protein [Neobacillus sp. PS2-9]|uniref:hypothetical protein n=1 Tax=Neobacillus sp. PS2-9 TaxID=3070676 RepID=UPI0027DF416D|nr:hypothetical protein [Neobacillus sp. PS2-9]WML58576.1 hypothetical protein RCG25_01935 [Neobacillus sp. PS2-9]
MPVISIFEHSLALELAISELENHHIEKERILAASVNKNVVEKKYLDPFNADGLNLFLVSGIGMSVMLLGTMYGFVLYWGPVLWGLIGLIAGSIVGLVIDYIWKKTVRKKTLRKIIADVLLIVNCEEDQVELVEGILKQHHTLGLVRI